MRFAVFQSISASHISSIREIHLRAQRADVLLEPFGVDAVFVYKVQLLNAAIATPASYLPLIKDNKALLRARIEIPNRASVRVFNKGASLAAFRTATRLTRTGQKQRYPTLIIGHIAKLITAEIEHVSEYGG